MTKKKRFVPFSAFLPPKEVFLLFSDLTVVRDGFDVCSDFLWLFQQPFGQKGRKGRVDGLFPLQKGEGTERNSDSVGRGTLFKVFAASFGPEALAEA